MREQLKKQIYKKLRLLEIEDAENMRQQFADFCVDLLVEAIGEKFEYVEVNLKIKGLIEYCDTQKKGKKVFVNMVLDYLLDIIRNVRIKQQAQAQSALFEAPKAQATNHYNREVNQ